jgi:septal ring factor EnvC (AmiA/AmiB activator)
MVRALSAVQMRWLFILAALVASSGCSLVPRASMDECQRLSKALRTDNARLKDQVLALQSQNRDYAERAVDDSRRLAMQDETIERLEQSVQAYQTDRSKLESAYQQLTSSLDGLKTTTDEWPTHVGTGHQLDGDTSPRVSSRPSKSSSIAGDDEPQP